MLYKNNVEYFPKDNIILRTIHGSYFLIDILDNYKYDKCNIYEINQTGKFIWEKIHDVHTLSQLTKMLKENLIDEIDKNIIKDDIIDFLESLQKRNFIEVLQYE